MSSGQAKNYGEMLRVAVEASTKAGEIVAANFHKISSVRLKGKANPVTDIDLLAEETIVNMIERQYPDHNILCEEVRSVDHGADFTWVIDPLDGTVNFTAGLPFVATSVGIIEGKTPVVGAVYEPVRGETFTAMRGGGAFLNGQPITVGRKTEMTNAVVGVDLGYDEPLRRVALEKAIAIIPDIQSLRICGSAVLGLCYVACGRFDAYWHQSIYPWDIIAATVLVREAGGEITDLYGNAVTIETRNVAAANAGLHSRFMKMVGGALHSAS